VLLVFFCGSVWNIPLVGPFEVDCGKPRPKLPYIECDCCDCLADSVAHRNCFAEVVFESLHSGVSVDNDICDEVAKALGDALKDNTTLTSLTLDLSGE
jgi:hypothetical protein